MFICRPDNYATLNKIKLRFQDTIEIVRCFTDDSSAFRQLRDVIKTHACVFQYVYANLFPRYFARIDDYGVRCRLEFDNPCKTYLGQKTNLSWGVQSDQPEIKTEPAEDKEDGKNEEKEEMEIEPPKTPKKDVAMGLKRKIASKKKIKKHEIKKAKLLTELAENTLKIKNFKKPSKKPIKIVK